MRTVEDILPRLAQELGLARMKTPPVLPPIPPILLEGDYPATRSVLALPEADFAGQCASAPRAPMRAGRVSTETSSVQEWPAEPLSPREVTDDGGSYPPARGAIAPAFPSGGAIWLSARDPFCLCLNWGLDRSALAVFAAAHPGGGWWLRVHAGSVGSWLAEELPLPDEADFCFVPVTLAGTTFVAEVGYRFGDGGWRSLAVSQPATTPVDSPADFAPAVMARFERISRNESPPAMQPSTPPPDAVVVPPPPLTTESVPLPTPEAALQLTRLVWEPVVTRPNVSSAEVTEWRAREETTLTARASARPGLPTALPSSAEQVTPEQLVAGGPASGEVPPGPTPAPGFWFKVNAELIIYGSTERDARVTVAGRPVRLREDGSFSFRFALPDGEFTLPAVAINATGTDGRAAQLRFTRGTAFQGEVGAHPQDQALQPPVPSAIS